LGGGSGTDQDKKPCHQHDRRPVRGRISQIRQQTGHACDSVAHPNGCDIGISIGQIPQDLGFGLGRGIDRGDKAVRGAGQCGLVHHHHKPHAGGGKIHIPQAGDCPSNIAPQNVHGQGISKPKAQFGGLFGGKADLRGACIIFGPPCALENFRGVRQGGGIGDATIAAHHPVITSDVLGGLPIDAGHKPAQHRCGLRATDLWVLIKAIQKSADLGFLDIDKEIRRGHIRKVARNRIAQVAVNLADGRQHRQAQPQRQDDRTCRFFRRGNCVQGPPQRGTFSGGWQYGPRQLAYTRCGERQGDQGGQNACCCPKSELIRS